MSGDPTNRNDDELLSQIDELKARMDRLMSGGTSTSNSALLTDEVKPESGAPRPGLVDQAVDPAPTRTRVRDLIGPAESEVVENRKEEPVIKVINDGSIGSSKKVTIQGYRVKLPFLTDRDKEDILFAIDNKIGISLDRSEATVADHTITGDGTGITITSGGSPTIMGNDIDVGGRGISVSRGTRPVISDNTVCGDQESIYVADGAKPTLSDNETC